MRDYKYIKSNIKMMNSKTYVLRNVIFRIINIQDKYYFAEEISTGCIFPIFNFVESKNDSEKGLLNYYSYVRSVESGVFFPLIGAEDKFKCILDETDVDFKDIGFPNRIEVGLYLQSKKKDEQFLKKIKDLELKNEYFCGINFIKDYIKDLQKSINIPFCNTNPKYEEYVPSVDFSSISNYGIDLTNKEYLCDAIDREKEIESIIKSICIKGNSVILIGEVGAGKKSLVEKLALIIKEKENNWLKDYSIFKLDLNSIKNQSEFEKLIKPIIEKYKGRIIIFIDEINKLVDLPKLNNVNIINFLKPYMEDGSINVIGTAIDEKFIDCCAEESSYFHLFETIEILEPKKETCIKFLSSYIDELEFEHGIKVNLSDDSKNMLIECLMDMVNENTYDYYERNFSDFKIVKSIIENTFADVIYNGKDSVEAIDFHISIISCELLERSFRLNEAENIKSILNALSPQDNKSKIIKK